MKPKNLLDFLKKRCLVGDAVEDEMRYLQIVLICCNMLKKTRLYYKLLKLEPRGCFW